MIYSQTLKRTDNLSFFAYDYDLVRSTILAGQNSNFVISDVTIAKLEAKFYHCDVIMATFENLSSQICYSAHWESNLGDGLQKSFFCFVAVNRQTISFVFLSSRP